MTAEELAGLLFLYQGSEVVFEDGQSPTRVYPDGPFKVVISTEKK